MTINTAKIKTFHKSFDKRWGIMIKLKETPELISTLIEDNLKANVNQRVVFILKTNIRTNTD